MSAQKKKRRGCFWHLLSYGAAGMFYAGLGTVSFLAALYGLASGGEEVPLPDVRGKLRAEAEAALPDGLALKVIEEACTYPAGTIVSQNEPPGKKVKLPHQLEVLVSKGGDQRPVPDLINLPLDYAKEQLARDGLRAGTVQEVERAESPVLDGAVLESHPSAGTMLPVGGAVDLIVRREARPQITQIPNLINQRIGDIESISSKLGVKVERIDKRFDSDHAPGTIIEQYPAPGTPITEGMMLRLVVAEGADGAAPQERGGDAGATRTVPLYFVVPPGVGSYEVRVALNDATGEHEVYRDNCEPGRRLLINLTVSGRGYAYIYVAGDLNRVVPL